MQIPDHAHRLAKNPLGIIALFLFLVYGIAGLVFGLAARNLDPAERLPLIWFLVGFPVLVLLAFGWLVSRHHTKLYAPSDYRDAEGFFRAMTPTERRERLEREVAVVEAQIAEQQPANVAQTPVSSSVQLREQIALAEELALRELESEFGQPVLRQVIGGRDRGYDGVFQLPDREVAIEVKYTRSADWSRLAHEAIALGTTFMGKGRARPVTVLLAVVADALTEEQRSRAQNRLEKRLSESSAVSVKLRVYDLAELKKKFGIAPA